MRIAQVNRTDSYAEKDKALTEERQKESEEAAAEKKTYKTELNKKFQATKQRVEAHEAQVTKDFEAKEAELSACIPKLARVILLPWA